MSPCIYFFLHCCGSGLHFWLVAVVLWLGTQHTDRSKHAFTVRGTASIQVSRVASTHIHQLITELKQQQYDLITQDSKCCAEFSW